MIFPELVAAYLIRKGPRDYRVKAALDSVDAAEIQNEEKLNGTADS